MKLRVLFIDDEPLVLAALSRMLHGMRDEWDTVLVPTASAALELMDREPFDVVVSDMRMSGMGGVDLLEEVARRHPSAVRIILSGRSDRDAVFRSIGPTHQFLSKPCDAALLISTITRAGALRGLLPSESLRTLVGRLSELTVDSSSQAELSGELAKGAGASAEQVSAIVAHDFGMTSKLLQLVNSSFFGVGSSVNDVQEAVAILGLDVIRSLMVGAHLFETQPRGDELAEFLVDLERHATSVASFASAIYRLESAAAAELRAPFMAGFLHDVGKLILANHLPTEFTAARELAARENLPPWRAETEILGASHAQVGAYLLGLWGLGDAVVEAVAFHHQPREARDEFGVVAAVHVADVLDHENQNRELQNREFQNGALSTARPEIDREFLEQLGLADRLPVWRDACQRLVPLEASS